MRLPCGVLINDGNISKKVSTFAAQNKQQTMKLINAIQDEALLLYLKPDNCLVRNNEDFYYPEFSQHITARLALVVRIKKIGKKVAERFASRYYDEVSVGLNFEAKDKLEALRQAGLPWDEAVAFDYSAPIGVFKNKTDDGHISLSLNDKIITTINLNQLGINKVISEASQKFTFKIGDLIYISLPKIDATLEIGQDFKASINEDTLLQCRIK